MKTVPEPSHLQACLRRQGERVRTNCAVQRTVALWAKICKDAVKEINPPPLPLVELQEKFGFTAPQGFVYANKYPKLYNFVYGEENTLIGIF